MKEEIPVLIGKVLDLERVLVKKAKAHLDTVMHGYTHLQRAQPTTFAHYMMAYANMFKRDVTRLEDCLERLDECPLGAGALATSCLLYTSSGQNRNLSVVKLWSNEKSPPNWR